MSGIDREALAQLQGLTTETGGDLVVALIDVFSESSLTLLTGLDGALSAGSAADAKRHAHTLKGAASTVGATEVAECARSIEQFAKDNKLADAQALLPSLRQLLPDAVSALRTIYPG